MSDITYTAAAATPVSVDEAKAHLNVSHASDDALIDGYIRAATALIEARTNRCFVTQTRTLKIDSFGDSRYVHHRRIYPTRSPLKSATITYVDANGATATLPSSDYVTSSAERPGYISEAYDATWPATRLQPEAVTVTYITGHSTVASGVPYNVKLAIEQLVAHWYRNRESHLDKQMSELPMGIAALLESEHLETYG